MNYEKFIKDIETYLKAEIKTEIDLINLEKDDYVVPYINKFETGYPDTTKNTENLVFYILPNIFSYEFLSNQSKLQNSTVNMYLTIKGFKSADIEIIMYRYA